MLPCWRRRWALRVSRRRPFQIPFAPGRQLTQPRASSIPRGFPPQPAMAIETAPARQARDGWRESAPLAVAALPHAPVEIDGKQFAAGGVRFPVRGVTYGTFVARADGALFPEPDQLESDLEAIADSGFNVVRTYTPPPDDMLAAAERF